MKNKNITCFDIADYFLNLASKEEDEEEMISNLKLQKLVYYAQGLHLAMFDSPLFMERIEAWTHGPVIPKLYHAKKHFGNNPVSTHMDVNITKFTEKQINFLNEIYEVYGQFSAAKLRNLTHTESPWLKNKDTNTKLISHDDLIQYFKTQLN